MERLTGSLTRAYALDIPADPGGAQPARHSADAPGGGVERDDAPAGGGWQPSEWDSPLAPMVLPGDSRDPYGQDNRGHVGKGHKGPRGRGTAREAAQIPHRDTRAGRGRHGAAGLDTAGAAGAAHGGLVATGVSAPWANAPVFRRRADGAQVRNPGGLRLGSTYTPVGDRHRQGLHFNRPFLRFVRINTPVVERSSPNPGSTRTAMYDPLARERTAGPVEPRLRRIQRPYGQTDYVDVDQNPAATGRYDAGPIGGDWAR